MKMHKIRNIDKDICSAEQKIAYNYACSFRRQLEDIYNSDNAEFIKQEAYQKVINLVLKCIKSDGTNKRYNIDAIVHCFRNGIEKYCQGYSILTSYEEIGQTFECLYDIE